MGYLPIHALWRIIRCVGGPWYAFWSLWFDNPLVELGKNRDGTPKTVPFHVFRKNLLCPHTLHANTRQEALGSLKESKKVSFEL